MTRSGVLRPTTRSPVLVHHPDDAEWFGSDHVLPDLARLTGDDPEPTREDTDRKITTVRLATSASLPPGLALLDAPDIDSVVDTNRELATQLLAAADLWLFVTTAARYADAVPWDLLRTAVERGTSVAVVLDRVPPDAMAEVRTHLAQMLRDNGLGAAPLFTVTESTRRRRRRPAARRSRSSRCAPGSPGWRRAPAPAQLVVRRTLAGALASLDERVPVLVDGADQQAETAVRLRTEVATAYAEADRRLEQGLTDGSLLRGEVLARWQEFVGTGELFRGLESAVGRLRDRVVSRRSPGARTRPSRSGRRSRPGSPRSCAPRPRTPPSAAAPQLAGATAPGRPCCRRPVPSDDPAAGRLRRAAAAAGPRLAGRRPRPGPRAGGVQAQPGPRAVARRQRARRRPHGGRVRQHRVHPDRRRGGRRCRHRRRRPEAARGDLRRPGRARARGAGPRPTCSTGSTRCSRPSASGCLGLLARRRRRPRRPGPRCATVAAQVKDAR